MGATAGAASCDSLHALDRDVHGAKAEQGDEEPTEATGTADRVESCVLTGSKIELELALVPGVVHAKDVMAGRCGPWIRIARTSKWKRAGHRAR
jgi:hypothetical protein